MNSMEQLHQNLVNYAGSDDFTIESMELAQAQEVLAAEGIDVRVVSMPCMDLFEQQSASYKESILPKKIRARVAVEAAMDFGWGRYTGLDGAAVTMEGFGASAPAGVLFKKFGFTKEHVAEVMRKVVKG